MSFNQLSQGRTLAAAALFMAASATTGFAQCPADDATTTNNDCANAAVAVTGPLSVQDVAEDFWTFTVNGGDTITIDVNLLSGTADLDLGLFDDAGICGNQVDGSGTVGPLESVTYDNLTASPVTLTLRVFLFSGTCEDYDMVATTMTLPPDPCATIPDDAEEENDDCLSAVVPSANPLSMLFVSKIDEDFYSIDVPAGDILTVDVPHINLNGDVDAELLASDCATVLDGSFSVGDNENLSWANTTGAVATVIVRVYLWSGDDLNCNADYGLIWSTGPDPCTVAVDDMFEENDDCTTAAPVSTGLQTGLFVRKEGVDEDWYSIDVNDGGTLIVTCSFVNNDGDIDIDLFDGCAGTLLEGSAGVSDIEDVTWTNNTGATVNVKWGVFVWAGDPTEDCNNYDMDVDVSGGGPGNIVPYCFGDGSGTPCPCGNNSTAGHPGGCANSAGNGGILTATGNASVMADTLNLDLASASQNSFALLVSGINQLPQTGGCIGCGIPAFDGLRCAGGQFLRHGSRATDAMGDTGNGWGPPGGPAGGLIAANGFMMGETRNFFAFYRDDTMAVCMTGQNSSNGVSITFQP